MKEFNINSPFEVDAVPGSAFLAKKKVLVESGLFDEKLFLFFEEYDIGIRIKDIGLRIFVLPKVRIFHNWKKDRKLKKYFDRSRFYYFRKHYGLLSALLVDFFIKLGEIKTLVRK